MPAGVTSLKIAIQCAKLLADPKVPAFYPSAFVLVTTILDTFGRLVFERLRASAAEEHGRMGNARPLPEDFSAADVGAETRETCRNWFYKTACIRELLPRLYIELALLECYRFLNADTDFSQILLRLSHCIRGVGDPLVAVYARWYLARMAVRLVRAGVRGGGGAARAAAGGGERESALASLADYLASVEDMCQGRRAVPALQAPAPLAPGVVAPPPTDADRDAALSAYLALHSPAVAWIAHQAGWGASRETFQAVLTLYRDKSGCAMVLRHVLDAFDAAFFAPHAAAMMGLCREARAQAAPGSQLPDLYRSMALALARSPPPEAFRITFLNEVWKTITRAGDAVVFARNAAALVELLLAHYGTREVLILLGDLVKRLQAAGAQAAAAAAAAGVHVQAASAPPAALPSLERLLSLLVEAEVRALARAAVAAAAAGSGAAGAAGAGAGAGLVTSEHFAKLLDMFPSDAKPALCRRLLASFVAVPGPVTDPVVVTTLLEIARACHDSLDLLSAPEETAAVTALVEAFLAKIDFGRDLQRQLEVLTDCRRAFTQTDALRSAVIDATAALAARALQLARGRHTQKTAQFARAVFASVSTSISGLDDPFLRMRTSQRCARAALESQCLGQADLLFRAAIQEIPELPQAMAVHIALSGSAPGGSMDAAAAAQEQRLYDLLRDFSLAAAAMPGHPEHGPFYLARGLLNAVQKFPWARGAASPLRCRSTLLLLPLLHAFAADPLPGRVPGVESNDVLFHGDAAYLEELRLLQRSVLEVAVAQLADAQQAVQAGDAAARAVVLDAVPDLLAPAALGAALELDAAGAVPLVERAALMLKAVAPEHALVGQAVQQVKAFIAAQRKKAGAATAAA